VVLDDVSSLLHRFQTDVGCPEIPFLQKGFSGLEGLLIESLKIEFYIGVSKKRVFESFFYP
jgi:hypothetical protein